MTTLASLRRGLEGHEALRLADPPQRRGRAAVALVFGGGDGDLSLCFVKRARRPGERWSGDMAFPGGWVSPEDANVRATALRETREEVGLNLRSASYIGRLDDRRIGYSGEQEAPVLSSFVFGFESGLPELRPDGWETESAYWISLEHLRGEANRTVVPWDSGRLPGIRYRDQVIWGLTLWVFRSLEAVIRAESAASAR